MKPATLAQLAFIFLAGLAVFAFVHGAKMPNPPRLRPRLRDAAQLRRPKPPGARFRADRCATGRKVHLSDYRGKTVVLNFWTTTCQPCLEEMPSLAELAKF